MRTLLTDRYFWRAFVNTFVVVNVIVYVELALGLGIATLFAAGIPWRPAVLAIVLMPYAVSEVVAVIIWRFLMDPEIGIVTRPLTDLGLPYFDWAIDPAHGLALVCLISVWLHLPFTFLIVYAARLTVPGAVRGGADRRRDRLADLPPRHLPDADAGDAGGLVFRYIFAFRLFSEVWLLTKGGPARLTEVLAVYLYSAFTLQRVRPRLGHRLGHGAAVGADRRSLPAADATGACSDQAARPRRRAAAPASRSRSPCCCWSCFPISVHRPVVVQAGARDLRLPAALAVRADLRALRSSGRVAGVLPLPAEQPDHRLRATLLAVGAALAGFVYSRYRTGCSRARPSS